MKFIITGNSISLRGPYNFPYDNGSPFDSQGRSVGGTGMHLSVVLPDRRNPIGGLRGGVFLTILKK